MLDSSMRFGRSEEPGAEEQAAGARLGRLAGLRSGSDSGGPSLGLLLEDDAVGGAVLRPELHGLRALCRLRRVCRRSRELIQIPCLIMHGADATGQTFDPLPRNRRVYCLDLARLAWSECMQLPHPLRSASLLGLPDGGLVVAGGHSIGTYGCVEVEDQHMPDMPYGLALDRIPGGAPNGPMPEDSAVPGDADYEPKMVGKQCSVYTEQVWRAARDLSSDRAGWTALAPLPAVPVRGCNHVGVDTTWATVRGRSLAASCTLKDGRLLITGGQVCYPDMEDPFPTHYTTHRLRRLSISTLARGQSSPRCTRVAAGTRSVCCLTAG